MSRDFEVSPERAAELLSTGATAVDVREDYEYEAGKISGATHVELVRVPSEADNLSDPVVFYCRSGERSAMAAEALRASGRDAVSIEGGLLAWVERGQPIDPADGSVVQRRPGS